MDNFIGKTGTGYSDDYWCETEGPISLDRSYSLSENETTLYIKKGIEELTIINVSDLEKNATVNYFYCQPKGAYKTGETVDKENELKKLEAEFN
jgi:hypothetical protein